jgi:hypothetical protein
MKKILIAVAALFAVGVVAQSNVELRLVPQVFRGGFWSGSAASATAANIVTGVYAGSVTTDFASTTIQCEDSAAITVTGAQAGDPCFVGFDSATVNAAHSSFTCYALANQAKVRHCPAGTATNPAEAVFRVRVISSR